MLANIPLKAQYLNAGADWLETHPWLHLPTAGVPMPDGVACAVTAIARGVGGCAKMEAVLSRAEEHALIMFNDARGRTKEEVIAEMRRLAREACNEALVA